MERIPVSSRKGSVGHLVAGAGALNAMVCALSIGDGLVPPTTNLTNPDPDCDLAHPGGARLCPVAAPLFQLAQRAVVAFDLSQIVGGQVDESR